MPVYKAPLRDMRFVLKELWNIEEVLSVSPKLAEVTVDVIDAVLEEAAKINENLLFPLNQSGDQQGCQFNDGDVKTPPGFKEAYQQLVAGGWPSLTGEPEFGGQGFPQMINVCFEEMMCSSNLSFSLYAELTHGVGQAIYKHASDELKALYLPKLISGEWTAVMCLTESHCGSDLGLLRTKANVNGDGAYHITGSKIFITGGEHDLADNIVHLVLARLPDAPPGVKGISLFLVPKFLPNSDGSLGDRNHVHCGSIEHKMGIKGSATCVMNYDNAIGYLVGEPHKGLAAMFTVMNIARLAIGLEGLGLAEVSYQNALAYAKERLQGRAPDKPLFPEKAADPIIVHPDVRRMLLTMKAYNEAARALVIWAAKHVDIAKFHTDDKVQAQAESLVALLTPIVKAFTTDYGFEACNLGLQVLGGHGYVSEWGMEQYVRDARIAQIYEGTNGIQAMDLVKRKLVFDKGQALHALLEQITGFIAEHNNNKAMAEFSQPLTTAIGHVEQASRYILTQAGTNKAELGANANEYLHLLSLTVFGYMWLRMAAVALAKQDGDDSEFYAAKLLTARFYMQRILPKTASLAQIIQAGSEPLMAMPIEHF